MNPLLPPAAQRRIVLASASPRRRELLSGLGVPFEVDVSEFVETATGAAESIALANALGKARDVAARRPGDLVIGADTVVVLDDELLGKPADDADGAAMLAKLSGREHAVITGVALVRDAREASAASRTAVRFRDLKPAEIVAYLASGEPSDKAGAYGIQGLASQFVTGITGCYFNVMGLPLELLTRMLREWGAGP